jgi:hypothetical protein
MSHRVPGLRDLGPDSEVQHLVAKDTRGCLEELAGARLPLADPGGGQLGRRLLVGARLQVVKLQDDRPRAPDGAHRPEHLHTGELSQRTMARLRTVRTSFTPGSIGRSCPRECESAGSAVADRAMSRR